MNWCGCAWQWRALASLPCSSLPFSRCSWQGWAWDRGQVASSSGAPGRSFPHFNLRSDRVVDWHFRLPGPARIELGTPAINAPRRHTGLDFVLVLAGLRNLPGVIAAAVVRLHGRDFSGGDGGAKRFEPGLATFVQLSLPRQ